MVSKASASSLAKACSSSYSPGLPMRSNSILPRFVYLKKKKIASTSTAMPAEPNADRIPIRIPFPVDPALILIMTDDNSVLTGCSADGWLEPWLLSVDEVGRLIDWDANEEVESVEVRRDGSNERRMASVSIAACFCIACSITADQRNEGVATAGVG
jgi:hypothetical protein